MTNAYKWVQWNTHKKVYDLVLLGSVIAYLSLFVLISTGLVGDGVRADPVVSVMRALGTCALVLLHIILAIGPLARLSGVFVPLLYNRRHMGVTMCVLAFAHAVLAVGYYGAFGIRNPVSAVVTPTGAGAGAYELFGLAALLIILVMGATSHDFWLKNLTPACWKTLHMGVYGAYTLILAHVVFGALRGSGQTLWFAMLAGGFVTLCTLHLVTGIIGARDPRSAPDPWTDVCAVGQIPESRAARVTLHNGDRVAVFEHNGSLSAVSDICAHQGGPLSEGKVIDGCITCPWHGYQYRAHDGCSPPPYTEKIPTYEVRIEGGRVQIKSDANEPGTPVEPCAIEPERLDRGDQP